MSEGDGGRVVGGDKEAYSEGQSRAVLSASRRQITNTVEITEGEEGHQVLFTSQTRNMSLLLRFNMRRFVAPKRLGQFSNACNEC